MPKEEIKQIYKKKLNEFTKHNYLYYEKSKPVITDAQYDKLKREIIELEKKYKYLRKKILQLQKLVQILRNHLKNFNIKFQCYLFPMHLKLKI